MAGECVASAVDASWWRERCARKMVEFATGAKAAAWSCGGWREWRLPLRVVLVAEIRVRVSCEMEEMMTWQCLIGADKFARI